MKFISITLLFVFSSIILFAQKPDTLAISFQKDKAIVSDAMKKEIQTAIEKNKTDKLNRVLLITYADKSGAEKMSTWLADERTYEVHKLMAQDGISGMQLFSSIKNIATADENMNKEELKNTVYIVFEFTDSYQAPRWKPKPKDEEPVVEKKEEEEKPKTDDEEVAEKTEKVKEPVKEEASKEIYAEVEKPNPIFKSIVQKPQLFKDVNSKYEITVTGKEGTVITIPKQSLVNKNGEEVKDNVTVELKEYYKKADMILANLTTVSGIDMLQSAGMIYVAVTYKGEELSLKPGAEISVSFKPKNKDLDRTGMKAFYADTVNNQINWNPSVAVVAPVEEDTKEKKGNKKVSVHESALPAKDVITATDPIVLSSANLHWVNCDAFTNTGSKTDIVIEVDSSLHAAVRIVFKDMNAILPAAKYKGKYTIYSVPVGKRATIIAFSESKKEVYYAAMDIKIERDEVEKLTLTKTNLAAMKLELAKLDK